MTRWLVALPLLAAPLAPLPGQTPSDRPALDRFHDSLAAVYDTASLRQSYRSLSRLGKDDPAAGLRAGYVALRLAELDADPDAGDARRELGRLVRREPDWPYVWHALAAAEQQRAGWLRDNPLELGSRAGAGALERALELEGRALEADPAFVPAAVTLAGLALGLRDTSRYAGARDLLRKAEFARGAGHAPAQLLLARARLERATGESDSAAAVFARVASGPGGSNGAPSGLSALARLELARTLLGSGARGATGAMAESAYYSAAAEDDSAVVAAYRADLIPIATISELARFDAARGPARAEFLRRFWTDRDRVELRADGERLREHYRRLLYARRHFALTITRRYYGRRDAWHSGSEELDDRGLIYVRHGEPATRLRPFVFGLMPNETWRYARADGDLLLHFSAGYDESGGGDLYDYRLVESIEDLRGASDAPRDQLLLSRQSLSPWYGRMLSWGPNGSARASGHERAIGRASIDYGTTSDSYELVFGRRLTAYANLVAIGTRGGRPLAHFVFAIAPAGTTPHPPHATYAIRARLVALDAFDHAVAHADTVVTFGLARPLARGQYLVGRVELPVPAGEWTWRAALSESDSAGLVLPRDSVRVTAPGPGLTLSDLALGIPAASARWLPTPADTVLLTPFDLFLEGSAVQLYYEAAGTTEGASYRHHIAVYQVKRNGKLEARAVVRLGFDERAGGPAVRAHRTLQLARLKPGSYVVEVRVEGPGGSTVRRREMRVVGGTAVNSER
ncbi:MAG TPA: GWxTD domain-containing protein [Gemmatimonadales bacterium]